MYGFVLGFKSKCQLPERAVPEELEHTALEYPWDHLTQEQCKELSPDVHRLLVQRKINTQRKSSFFILD